MADDTNTPRDDAQVRRDEAAAASHAVETRAVGSGTAVVNRRAQTNPKAKRAETRGIYRDPVAGARRVVGQGQVIPAGWERIESATIEDRTIEGTREAHASGQDLNRVAQAAPAQRSNAAATAAKAKAKADADAKAKAAADAKATATG